MNMTCSGLGSSYEGSETYIVIPRTASINSDTYVYAKYVNEKMVLSGYVNPGTLDSTMWEKIWDGTPVEITRKNGNRYADRDGFLAEEFPKYCSLIITNLTRETYGIGNAKWSIDVAISEKEEA